MNASHQCMIFQEKIYGWSGPPRYRSKKTNYVWNSDRSEKYETNIHFDCLIFCIISCWHMIWKHLVSDTNITLVCFVCLKCYRKFQNRIEKRYEIRCSQWSDSVASPNFAKEFAGKILDIGKKEKTRMKLLMFQKVGDPRLGCLVDNTVIDMNLACERMLEIT